MPPVIKIEDQKNLVPTKNYPHAKFKHEYFNQVQSGLIPIYHEDCNIVVAAPTGVGKAQPLDAKILTSKGFVRMGDIKTGDDVIGSYGKPIKVTGVYPQGIKSIYKINFSDDTHTHACGEHLWSVRTKSDKHAGKPYKCMKTDDLIKDLKYSNGERKWFVPIISPVEFSECDVPIDPYMLGLLLGDGGITKGVIFSTADKQLIDEIKIRLIGTGAVINHIEFYDYRITSERPNGEHWFPACNWVKNALCDLNLFGLKSHEKFIPDIYKISSVSSRVALLRGLMDTDGDCPCDGRASFFNTSSKKLANDVIFLVRSLGGVPTLYTKKNTHYTYKGKRLLGRTFYRVRVSIDGINPFLLERKSKCYNPNPNQGRTRGIVSIEPAGYAECQCIKVDADDQLYVTDDFILTHNTTVAEIMLAHEVRVRKGKGLFLAPMKALAQEKYDEWTDSKHHFADLKVVICTGDYKMTPELKEKLESADIILFSTEMLNSKCRNNNYDKTTFLTKIGTCVLDESHILTVPGRGDHVEAGLMKFTDINPSARLVLLSATMPNVSEIADWVSYSLTGRKTYLIESTYRQCPLTIHYERYWDGSRSYEENELQKVNTALGIVEYYDKDKFIVFAHTKKTGEQMKLSLQRAGIECEFHNADLEKDKRIKLEHRFREDPKLRVVIATSTLAYGLNMPARRVVILGVHRGLNEVETYDIFQMAGRAGRPAYDPMGDVYILIPESKDEYHKKRIQKPQKIQSQMIDQETGNNKVLAFHLVSEIYQGNVKTKEDVHSWYKRSLAKFQSKELDEIALDDVMELLRKCGAIWLEDDGTYTVTSVGKIASLYYYSPFDVADLKKNFTSLFQIKQEDDDVVLAMALGNLDTHRGGIVSKADREEMGRFAGQVNGKFPGNAFMEPAVKAGYAYYTLLNGLPSTIMVGMQRGLQFDFPRLNQVLYALDSMAGKWGRNDFFRRLQLRISYGVKGDMVYLCQLPNIGKVRATKLWDAGLRTVDAIAANPAKVKALLNMKQDKIDEIISAAKCAVFANQ